MATPTLSYKAAGAGVHADVDRLVASRMLVQANSGGGKSRALRQLLEETHGRVQHLVLDPEGEFATLREKFDYVLFGKEGDFPATPKTAKLLCRRLVELGASAVIDLYDLSLQERREFMKLFLTELMALPRTLWHPILVVIDEAHLFVPERGSGESQATEAVISLCTQGRKRGYAAILATQRISKLHKDAAAELLNKLIGRTGLDVDMKRAGDELGLDKEGRRALARLAPGEFYAYGPAISNEIQVVRTGAVTTTHPEAGRLGAAPPAAPAAVKAMLAKLADLPKEAEEEARTVADLQRQLRDTQTKLRKVEKSGSTVERVVEKVVVDERAVQRAVAAAVKPYQQRDERLRRQVEKVLGATRAISEGLEPVAVALGQDAAGAVLSGQVPIERVLREGAVSAPAVPRPVAARPAFSARSNTDSDLPKGERIVLTAVAQYPDGVERDQLSILSGYKRSTRDAYVQRLGEKGYIEARGALIVPTDDGLAALGDDYEPLPTGDALRDYWLARLPDGERKILAALAEQYPDAVSRESLSDETGYKRSTRDAYIQRLGARRLVEAVGSAVRARALLFGRG